MIAFSALTQIVTHLLLRAQAALPGNPTHLPAVAPWLAFNTATSFTTNTNWQSYAGEATMSYLSQAVALTSHNFFSAGVGICVAVALIRGISRAETDKLGNFWVDLVRVHLYVLLPICVVYALFLVSQGVIQTWAGPASWTTLDGGAQAILRGPVASQEAIKMLGTNGGGYFNANSAHPFENPTPLTNFVQILSIFAIPAALCVTLGEMVKSRLHGWAVLAAMTVIAVVGILAIAHFEHQGNPILAREGVSAVASAIDPAGNMEGKEVRFGVDGSALFAGVTTDASCGAVNAMHDSFTPLGGLVPMLNIQLGEVVFGGAGAGMYGVLIYVLIAVFLAGLMVGRTPEYLGKKLDSRDIRLASIYILIPAFLILIFTALGVSAEAGRCRDCQPRRDRRRRHHLEAAPPRPERGALCLQLRRRQQRERVCGAHRVLDRSPDLLLAHARARDVLWPLPADRRRAGDRREHGPQEARPAGPRELSCRGAPLHGPARGGDRHRRSADVLPGPLSRPDRRAFPPLLKGARPPTVRPSRSARPRQPSCPSTLFTRRNHSGIPRSSGPPRSMP